MHITRVFKNGIPRERFRSSTHFCPSGFSKAV
jgi:hypothetical protein